MSDKKRLSACIITILLFLTSLVTLAYSDFMTNTHAYIEGDGKELIANIVDQCDNGGRIIVIDRVSNSELNHIVDCVYDNPDLFWVDTTYHALSVGKFSFIFLSEKYENINLKHIEIEEKANLIISTIIKDGMSEYDKTLAIHDWICDNVKYKKADNDSDQDIYGALVLGEARCAGYAEAFAYLLNKVDVQAEVISGSSIDRTGKSVSHAWNLVYIDEEPYYFDITWNDDADGHQYDYFGLTSDEFKLSHFPNEGYGWVESFSTSECYYIKNRMYLNEYSSANIATQILNQGTNFSIKCKDSAVLNDVVEALQNSDEIKKIMRWTGMSHVTKITYVENKNTNCLHVKILP